jgi:hypothetical protein
VTPVKQKKMVKRHSRRIESIGAGCDTCNIEFWGSEHARQAIEHAKATGHETWAEQSIITYYSVETDK